MFRKRLTWFWGILTALTLVIVARLVQIQVVDAAAYQHLADRIFTRPADYIAAPRGTIYDAHDVALVKDEPTFDVCIHFGVLAGRENYLNTVARGMQRRGDYPPDHSTRDIADDLRLKIRAMWRRLAELTGIPEDEIQQHVIKLRNRLERWQASAHQPIREENQLLPVLEDINEEAALAVRLELEKYPWLRVMPGSRRVAHDADALAHVLGRLGAASPDRIAEDPLRDDELRGLRRGEQCGVSGVERLADTSLRGQRGRIIQDYRWQVVERTEPVAGADVHLTIDAQVQRDIYDILQTAVESRPAGDQAGAAAVVIDVPRREIVALVSFPTYEYELFNEQYEDLRQDTQHLPLLFRAVQAQYPPGSICKAISLVGGLSEGVITATTRFPCTGHLLPDNPDRFRCWIYNQYGSMHDPQDGESAVRNSCNIYFFQVGQRLGPERLCDWFSRFGLGRPAGTGLIEESLGIVPTAHWLRRNENRDYQASDAWNFAIGQGEVTVTPLQAANVAATIASGFWAPVRLAYDSTGRALGAAPAPVQPFEDRHLQVLRRGMWRVVNERGGTGDAAKLSIDGYELCGKTGSAQTVPRVLSTRYICEWPDGRREDVIAATEADALAQFEGAKPKIVGRRAQERFPDWTQGDKLPSHAWFMGFTQPTSTRRGTAPTGRVYAIAVLIEFGGSGGHIAGPVAKEIAEYLLDR